MRNDEVCSWVVCVSGHYLHTLFQIETRPLVNRSVPGGPVIYAHYVLNVRLDVRDANYIFQSFVMRPYVYF